MNLPIPELGEFAGGFATACALILGAVAVRHIWPAVKGAFVKTETIVYEEYRAAVTALDARITGLQNAAAGAINAVRGDVGGLQAGIAYLEDRVFTLEKAVGIADPTLDPKAPPQPSAPANPPVQPTQAQAGVPLHA